MDFTALYATHIVNWESDTSQDDVKYTKRYVASLFKDNKLDTDFKYLEVWRPCRGIYIIAPIVEEKVNGKTREVYSKGGYIELNIRENTYKIMYGHPNSWYRK